MKHIPFILSIFLCLMVQLLSAQKSILGIMPFNVPADSWENTDVRSRAQAVEDLVATYFQKSNHFTLVERSKMDAIKAERELQKGEDFIESKAIEISAALGAQYVLTGNVSVANIEENTTTHGATYNNTGYHGASTGTVYHASIIFSIKVLDVSNGQVVVTENFKGEGGKLLGSLSGEKAFQKAMEDIEPQLTKFINKNFPVQIPIVEIQQKGKMGEAKTVLISGGSSFGLKKGDKLKIVEIQMIEVEGKQVPRKKEIGQMKITKVEDENFSIADITAGGKEVAEKMAAGIKLKVFTFEE